MENEYQLISISKLDGNSFRWNQFVTFSVSFALAQIPTVTMYMSSDAMQICFLVRSRALTKLCAQISSIKHLKNMLITVEEYLPKISGKSGSTFHFN